MLDNKRAKKFVLKGADHQFILISQGTAAIKPKQFLNPGFRFRGSGMFLNIKTAADPSGQQPFGTGSNTAGSSICFTIIRYKGYSYFSLLGTDGNETLDVTHKVTGINSEQSVAYGLKDRAFTDPVVTGKYVDSVEKMEFLVTVRFDIFQGDKEDLHMSNILREKSEQFVIFNITL